MHIATNAKKASLCNPIYADCGSQYPQSLMF